MKLCKDGRIWGQNNKQSGDHLGVSSKTYNPIWIKRGFNLNSKGRPFKKGHAPWNTGLKGFKGGKEHYRWKGGIRFPYPQGWTEDLKDSIRKRDNYKCQLCGCPQEECLRRLSIHHIDGDKMNLNPKNLVSLCDKCHSEKHKKGWLKKDGTIQKCRRSVVSRK